MEVKKVKWSIWKLLSKVMLKEVRYSVINLLIFSYGFKIFGFSWMKRRIVIIRVGNIIKC